VIPRARGEATWIEERAWADRDKRIAEATGEAGRFLAVLEEYHKAPEVTRKRIYLETVETVLPRVRRYVIDRNGVDRFDLKVLDIEGKR